MATLRVTDIGQGARGGVALVLYCELGVRVQAFGLGPGQGDFGLSSIGTLTFEGGSHWARICRDKK